jgi:aminoglycoside phosphotransferase (APT) family kinase protein
MQVTGLLMPVEPDETTAAAMVSEVLAEPISVSRFPTGLQHFVFEATAAQGRQAVVRVSRREDIGLARNSIYWSERLRPLGIPLPQILHADLTMGRHRFPFVILERLPGRDLGFVVNQLSDEALRDLARRLSDLQAIVTSLPQGRGYGFSPRLDGPFPHVGWADCIAASLGRSRRRIREAGVVSEHHVDRAEAAADRLSAYFASVPPTPFLHDITTKNVIVDGARLSGIVDGDDLCFGDPLLQVGLTRMALLASDHSATYADAWIDLLGPRREQVAALDFYTALFCIDFMAELGRRFNRAEPQPVEKTYVERLRTLLDRYLA